MLVPRQKPHDGLTSAVDDQTTVSTGDMHFVGPPFHLQDVRALVERSRPRSALTWLSLGRGLRQPAAASELMSPVSRIELE